jgi:primary-amine oxidase
MRLSSHPDANFYAYPLELCAEVSADHKIVKIFRMPTSENDQMIPVEEGLKPFDLKKIHSSGEYHPDLATDRRISTKPLIVSQPQGPSFEVVGNLVNWEKWSLRVGFNYVS